MSTYARYPMVESRVKGHGLRIMECEWLVGFGWERNKGED